LRDQAKSWRHNPGCFWCAQGVRVEVQDGRSRIDVVLDERFQGGPASVHGGVLAGLVDEALGQILGVGGATASLEIRFRAPVAIGSRVLVEGQVLSEDERSYLASATIRYPEDERPRVEASGRFVILSPSPPRPRR
jgi:acyl-coenzyme A thioesterase PaaI-like protein